MFYYKLARNQDPRAAGQGLLTELRAWADHCVRCYGDQPPTDSPSQAVYCAGWLPLIYFHPEHPGGRYLRKVRDQVCEHFTQSGAWKHGYWRLADVSIGLRHFELFLAPLARLDPDMVTAGEILDVAEHIGNWSEDVIPWFDEETQCFRSTTFGTDGIDEERSLGYDTPEHFHLVNLALIALRLNRSERYADWAKRYAGRWASAVLQSENIPVGLNADGPVYEPGTGDDANEATYRAEAFLSVDAIQGFLKIWAFSKDEVFRAAAEKLLDQLIDEIIDPNASALLGAIRFYRRITKSDRYDSRVVEEVQKLMPFSVDVLQLDTAPIYDDVTLGIGKREDLPHWREDGQTRQHNPILVGLAAEILGERTLAARALDLGAAYLSLAQRAFPDGREDADSARTVAAIARGHPNDNGAGIITEVLVPLMAQFK